VPCWVTLAVLAELGRSELALACSVPPPQAGRGSTAWPVVAALALARRGATLVTVPAVSPEPMRVAWRRTVLPTTHGNLSTNAPSPSGHHPFP
jgi:hypothetical protein